MKPDYTDITMVLDRSGSMESVKTDTIGGVNHFLDSQKAVPGEATFSLVQFDTVFEDVAWGVPLADAALLTNETFVPRGSTALLDAIGTTMERTGKRLAAMSEHDRPGKVIFVIVTDGHENASHRYTRHQIDTAIAHQRDLYAWQFIFLGANQDAIATAASLSIPAGSSITYAASPLGSQRVYAALDASVRRFRDGTDMSPNFTPEDRETQREIIEGES